MPEVEDAPIKLSKTPIDPRAASSVVLDGPPDLIGDELVRIEPVTLDGQQIYVPAGLAGASEYRTVVRAELVADELRKKIGANLDHRGGPIPTADVRLALDFRDHAGTAVASAGVGLESYANFHIQRLLPGGEQVKIPGTGLRTAAQLRELPLNERYALALPVLTERDKPTSEGWWQDLRRVQALAVLQRHAITEPHSRRGLEGERPLLQRLYDAEYRGAGECMLEAFDYFTPGWIDATRRQALLAER
jgi:hypothetical protein